MKFLEKAGYPTQGAAAIGTYAGLICILLVIMDLFNIFDGVGKVKSFLSRVLPGFFKEDKFRNPKIDG